MVLVATVEGTRVAPWRSRALVTITQGLLRLCRRETLKFVIRKSSFVIQKKRVFALSLGAIEIDSPGLLWYVPRASD